MKDFNKVYKREEKGELTKRKADRDSELYNITNWLWKRQLHIADDKQLNRDVKQEWISYYEQWLVEVWLIITDYTLHYTERVDDTVEDVIDTSKTSALSVLDTDKIENELVRSFFETLKTYKIISIENDWSTINNDTKIFTRNNLWNIINSIDLKTFFEQLSHPYNKVDRKTLNLFIKDNNIIDLAIKVKNPDLETENFMPLEQKTTNSVPMYNWKNYRKNSA